jgi:hypothetical protein
MWGVATQLGGIVQLRSAAGRITGGYAIDDYELELNGTEIDCDHSSAAPRLRPPVRLQRQQ